MSKLTDFNDMRDPALIAECIGRAQPVGAVVHTIAEQAGVTVTQGLTAGCGVVAPSLPEVAADTIQQLAALPKVEYDRVRKYEAKTIGMSQSALDAEVAAARRKLGANVTNDDLISDELEMPEIEAEEVLRGIPAGFTVTTDGVFWTHPKNGELVRVCDELHVTALARDTASTNWGRVLVFADADGVPHQWVMPMAMLVGDAVDLRRELAQQGLNIGATLRARNLLTEYIMGCKPVARARCVQKTGWFQNVFVLPDMTIGAMDETVLYQSEKPAAQYEQSGTLDEWKSKVSALCVGNSRMVLSLCAAFAGPLLHLTGQDSGGVHFVGPSSIGKTTMLGVAASVFGGPSYIQTWRATGNGLEGLCAQHNDMLLVLDEMGEVDPKEAGSIAYMIGNGAGKTRSDRQGDARIKKTWRLIVLSSGEVGLAQHMTEAGKVVRAGQEVRMIDMPADANAGHGVFEELHGFDNGGALSNALKSAAWHHYGVAGLEFIRAVTSNASSLPLHLKSALKKFVDENLPEGAGGQAARVCMRYAIMAAAGEVATEYQVTGWEPGTANRAAAACFGDWIEQRGGPEDSERDKILAAVRAYFETHGEARFTDLKADKDRITANRAGFRNCVVPTGQEFYVLPETYKREVCAGFNQRAVTKVLVEGWLQPGKDKAAQKRSLPGYGETRVYVITAEMWRDKGIE